MERLRLCTIGPADRAFLPYIPGNFQPLLEKPETVCVGAVYDGASCGAALAELCPEGYYLRYVFVDPAARLCGLGTYLIRGLLGQVKARGESELKAVYSPDMLSEGRQTLGMLERVGFSRPEPFGTGFSTCLGDIPPVRIDLPLAMAVYSAQDLPKRYRQTYEQLLAAEEVPAFGRLSSLEACWPELSSFCVTAGELSGWFLLDRKGEGCHLAGLYVRPGFRRGRTAAALIAYSLQTARELLPPETVVWTSAIDRGAYALCDKLLRQGAQAEKVTEVYSVYRF